MLRINMYSIIQGNANEMQFSQVERTNIDANAALTKLKGVLHP